MLDSSKQVGSRLSAEAKNASAMNLFRRSLRQELEGGGSADETAFGAAFLDSLSRRREVQRCATQPKNRRPDSGWSLALKTDWKNCPFRRDLGPTFPFARRRVFRTLGGGFTSDLNACIP
jgi:hypothetical protein